MLDPTFESAMRPDIQHDIPLGPLNTFGIAVRAHRFVRVESVDALHALRDDPLWSSTPHFFLGGGSNVLFTRDFDGLVVHLAIRGIAHLGLDDDAHLVAACCGEDWDAFVRMTVRSGWPGLENLALIPGSVGAAPVQNIGAYGVELASRFAWLESFDPETGATTRMDARACEFGYRDSVFKRALRGRAVITRVVFRLPVPWTPVCGYADVAARLAAAAIHEPTPQQMVDVVTAIRREKLPDPALTGNAGSFFKNPIVSAEAFEAIRATEGGAIGHREPDGRVKLAAAWLIDRCGWRGQSLPGSNGRAAVHDRQALVLVNRGLASGADVLELAAAIRDSVARRFAVELEPEPVIV